MRTIDLTAVLGVLLAGTALAALNKTLFQLSAAPGAGAPPQPFHKPWLLTLVMFACMTVCVPLNSVVDRAARWHARRQSAGSSKGTPAAAPAAAAAAAAAATTAAGSEYTVDKMPGAPSQEASRARWIKVHMLLALPAAFDLLATGLAFGGLVLISASTYQLLRGAEILFVAIIATTVFKRCLTLTHWLAIATSMLGVALVGVASVLAQAPEASKQSQAGALQTLQGVLMVLGAQALAAVQMTLEDYALQDLSLGPLEVVGWEGIWGTLLSVVLLLVLQFTPRGGVWHEDTLETLAMMRSSPVVLAVLAGNAAAFLAYNIAGLQVINCMGPVFRAVLDTLRTAMIWGTSLALYYAGSSDYGEPWTRWSPLQIAGFVVMITAMLMSANAVRLHAWLCQWRKQRAASAV